MDQRSGLFMFLSLMIQKHVIKILGCNNFIEFNLCLNPTETLPGYCRELVPSEVSGWSRRK